MEEVNIFWFRRDLRLDDNAGLYHALKAGLPVIPLFIFDTNILNELDNKTDRRVDFIHQQMVSLKRRLNNMGSDLMVFYDSPDSVFKKLLNQYKVGSVFTNHDYEPYALKRDAEIEEFLAKRWVSFKSFKDQVIFEKNEVTKDDGTPYTVYTPYSKRWKMKVNDFYLKPYPTSTYFDQFIKEKFLPIPELKEMGFEATGMVFSQPLIDTNILKSYEHTRDVPAINGTSRLSVHFRFGTLSIRKAYKWAMQNNDKWSNELIWREFYMQILWHFPHVVNGAFKPIYNNIEWLNNTDDFDRWCKGKTGVPIVDAGMRELLATGYMHNRVRMIVSSYLTKDLLIDWRWGEAFFAEHLTDYELSSNNGGWQWAAGSGVDAAPYFRIFNPELQTLKFDPLHTYIKRWLPEFGTTYYSKPIVDHQFAKKRCLEVYNKALKGE